MTTTIEKRSIVIAGHKTSISLEDAFWKHFKRIASERNMTLSDFAAEIDLAKRGNLSSAIRLAALDDLEAHAGMKYPAVTHPDESPTAQRA